MNVINSNERKSLTRECRGIYFHVDKQGHKTYFIRYRCHGRQYCESAGPTLTLARKVLAIRKAEIAEGRWGIHKVKTHTISELADKYREYIQANNLQGHNYESLIKNVLGFFGGKKISDVTPFLIESYKQHRRGAKRVFYKGGQTGDRKEAGERSVRPATINRELSVLSKMFAIAVREKWIGANPVAGVPRLREDNKMERILSADEENTLLAACGQSKTSHLRPIITIALYTGMRLSEILRLRWEQIDLGRDLITLVRTKNGKVRRVDISSKLKEVFLGLAEARDGEYVFPSDLRKDKNLGSIKTGFGTACETAGIRGLRFHDLRHTWTTRMLEKGNSPAVVRDLGGWSDLSILNRYAHSTAEGRRQAMESLVSKEETPTQPEEKSKQSVNENLFAIGRGRKALK